MWRWSSLKSFDLAAAVAVAVVLLSSAFKASVEADSFIIWSESEDMLVLR